MLITSLMKARVATVLIVVLFATPLAPLVAQTPGTSKPATTAKPPTTAKPSPATAKPAAAPAAAAAPDGGWPRSYTTASGAALVIYQPQVSSWVNQKQIEAYAAVAYTAKGGKPALGTLKLESSTSVAADQRLVSFSEFKIAESNFPTVPREQVKTIVSEITTAMPLDERVIALDRVLANIDTSAIIPKNV